MKIPVLSVFNFEYWNLFVPPTGGIEIWFLDVYLSRHVAGLRSGFLDLVWLKLVHLSTNLYICIPTINLTKNHM
jgi:hypothetical protein